MSCSLDLALQSIHIANTVTPPYAVFNTGIAWDLSQLVTQSVNFSYILVALNFSLGLSRRFLGLVRCLRCTLDLPHSNSLGIQLLASFGESF
jgi:hypothetical protein